MWKLIAEDSCGFHLHCANLLMKGQCCGFLLLCPSFVAITWSCMFMSSKVDNIHLELVYLFLSCVCVYACGILLIFFLEGPLTPFYTLIFFVLIICQLYMFIDVSVEPCLFCITNSLSFFLLIYMQLPT